MLSTIQRFDTVGSIATLSLHINDLQAALSGAQSSFAQLAQTVGQAMQAHNNLCKVVEALDKKLESLINGGKPDTGTDCTQNGSKTIC